MFALMLTLNTAGSLQLSSQDADGIYRNMRE